MNVRRAFWQYRRFWIAVGFIIAFAAVRIFLPNLAIFRGWEQRFSFASLDAAKLEIPADAKRIGSSHELEGVFKDVIRFDPQVADIQGPIMVAAWPCNILKAKAACVRYIWQGNQMTLVVSPKPKNVKDKHGPFNKGGLTGYLAFYNDTAMALVGPFTPDELKDAWPYINRIPSPPAN